MPSGPDGMKATKKRNPNHDRVIRRAHFVKERVTHVLDSYVTGTDVVHLGSGRMGFLP